MRILHVDPGYSSLPLTHVFNLAGIKHALTAVSQRCGFQIARELGHFLLELFERAECFDVEYGHEAPVIMASGRLDAETEAGEQPAQYLHHDGKATALVALCGAERQ